MRPNSIVKETGLTRQTALFRHLPRQNRRRSAKSTGMSSRHAYRPSTSTGSPAGEEPLSMARLPVQRQQLEMALLLLRLLLLLPMPSRQLKLKRPPSSGPGRWSWSRISRRWCAISTSLSIVRGSWRCGMAGCLSSIRPLPM